MYMMYGLPYCDATKLAMDWFNARGIAFTLHDYKTQGITASALQSWCTQKGWETILNKRSTTWRSLSPETQAAITTQDKAVETMVVNTSLIKRPVITTQDGTVMAVGVNEKIYEKVFTCCWPVPHYAPASLFNYHIIATPPTSLLIPPRLP